MLRSAVFAAVAVAVSFSTTAFADNVSESTQIGVQGGAFFNSNNVTQRGVININTNQQLGVVNIATANQQAKLRNRNFNTQIGVVANWGKNVNIVSQESNFVDDYNNYSENYQEGFINIYDVTQIEHSWRHRRHD
ncbi:MAG: hypothetical protein Q8P46_07595 [Hyphomicrobiales bacterium]|nr:hypothetical protein [Hyphomicrobiales bacterium]